ITPLEPEIIETGKLNINTATVAQLRKLGFSSKDASTILNYRKQVGVIRNIDELYKLDIDRKKLDEVKDKISTR
ncbi:MAG: helix-hairpin-helix domain-containing protein, partial [bacterium]|nr:helix-hairpin-helix domain-containing protein [bacterium]